MNEPYTAVVSIRLLRGPSLKESEIVEVQEGKTNYSVKILLLGEHLFCGGEIYCLFV